MMQKQGCSSKQGNRTKTTGENPHIKALLHKYLCLSFCVDQTFMNYSGDTILASAILPGSQSLFFKLSSMI